MRLIFRTGFKMKGQAPLCSPTSGAVSVILKQAFGISALCLALSFQAVPAGAQTAPGPDELRARAIERCKANRGVDCESESGLREWIMQEQPMTEDQRRSAVAARRYREQCRANPRKAGC